MVPDSVAWTVCGIWSVISAIGSTYLLLADTTTDVSTVVGPVLNVGSVGFAVWFGWYITTKTLPDKDRYHSEEENKLRTTFQSALDLAYGKFDSMIKDLRDEHREERIQFLASLQEHNKTVDRLSESINRIGVRPTP